MSMASQAGSAISTIMNKAGEVATIFSYTISYNQPYDDEGQTISGSSLGSVVWMPVSESRYGDDFKYVEQGTIKMDDIKVFMQSGVTVHESDVFFIPSLTGSFNVRGIFQWPINGKIIYQKIYLRRYTQG